MQPLQSRVNKTRRTLVPQLRYIVAMPGAELL